MDWTTIKKLKDPANANWVRDPEVETRYKKHINDLNGNHEQDIFENVMIPGQDITVTVNTFPYSLDPSLHHYLVWYRVPDLCTVERSRKVLKGYGLDPEQYIVWESNPEDRSVPGIRHHHVISCQALSLV